MTETKETAFTMSQDVFKTLLEGITDCLYVKDLNGVYQYINSACEQVSGKIPAEIIGRKDDVFFPSETVQRIVNIDREIIETGKTQTYSETITTSAGEIRTYLTTKWAYKDASGETVGIVGISRDVTAQKKAEDELRETHELLTGVLSNAPLPIYTVTNEGQFELFNEHFAVFAGHNKENLTGKILEEVYENGDSHLIREVNQKVIESGKPLIQEEWVDTADGRQYYKTYKFPIINAEEKVKSVGSILFDLTDHKRAEDKLRESESEFRALFEAMNDVILVINGDGIFVKIAPTKPDLLYKPADDMIGKSVYEVFPPEQAVYFHSQIKKVLNNGKVLNTEYSLPIGEQKMWFAATASRISQNKVLWVARNITEHKLAEQAKLVSETNLLLATEAAALGTWDFYYANKRYRCSDQLMQILGLSDEDEKTIERWREIVHPDDLERVLIERKKYVESNQVVHMEYRITHQKNQKVRWIASTARTFFDKSGQPFRTIGVAQDITDRKVSEQTLRESEERYRQLIEFAPTSIFLIKPDGVITHVNPAACQLLGYEFEELVGRDIYDFIRADKKEKLSYILSLKEVKKEFRGEWEGLRKDGSWIWIDAEARILPNGVWQSFFSDITERKKIEQQLRQSQKMEAVGRLAGGVAHDFNNLLTVITGYSELMLWKLRKDDPFYKNVQEIKSAAERAAGLTGQLLAFSRQQPQQLVVLNLNEVIENLEKLLKRLLSEDIELLTNLDDELGHTNADQGQIEQILMNLVVNARDAMSELDGGRILIETKNVRLTEEQAKQSLEAKAGSYISLMVTDTGCGMDAATQSQVFEPFFTTKDAGKGTGLGLSTVYGIVKQSGGFISVYSEVGYGTTFKIYLPRVDRPAVKVTGELQPLVTERGTETILLVEDDEMVRQLVKEVLQINGYKVLEANNGATALLVCQQSQEPIHLLLTDIVMPEMSGRRLVERLTAAHKDMQVIYMSGYTTDTVIHHGISSNAVNFIEKPFKFEELTGKVREVLDKKF